MPGLLSLQPPLAVSYALVAVAGLGSSLGFGWNSYVFAVTAALGALFCMGLPKAVSPRSVPDPSPATPAG